MAKREQLFARRRRRVRYHIGQVSGGRPRLSVFRLGKHIYAQIIDDTAKSTIAAASSLESAKTGQKKTYNVEAAAVVGKLIAQRAVEKGVKHVVFDRGGYLYHGRVKALADAARQAGLEF
jgi:large subunit ribosomal protein L18